MKKTKLVDLFDILSSNKVRKEIVSEGKEIMSLNKLAFENLGVLNLKPFIAQQAIFTLEKSVKAKPKLTFKHDDFVVYQNNFGFIFEPIFQQYIISKDKFPLNLTAVKNDSIKNDFIIIRKKTLDPFKYSEPISVAYNQILFGQIEEYIYPIAESDKTIAEKISLLSEIPVVIPPYQDQAKSIKDATKYAERIKDLIENYGVLMNDMSIFYNNLTKGNEKIK